ncbi:MAG: acyltransferase [Bacteroidales bacterium]
MTSWKGKTRGGLTGYKIFIRVLKFSGIKTSYVLLRFVVLYYFIFYPRSFKCIFSFYRKRLKFGFFPSVIFVYRNYFALGMVLLDKIAIMAGLNTKFEFDFEGEEFLSQMVEKKTGGLLISAHVGNFEMAAFMFKRLNTTVNIIMYDAEHEKVKDYLSSVIKRNFNVIVIKEDNSHIYELNKALSEKQIVCIHGDRFLKGSKTMTCDFLGGKAEFPSGPFYLALKYNVPVSFVFAMKRDRNSYHFSATRPEYYNQQGNQILRDKMILSLIVKYTARLEEILRNYPAQWFNYYNFWETDEK